MIFRLNRLHPLIAIAGNDATGAKFGLEYGARGWGNRRSPPYFNPKQERLWIEVRWSVCLALGCARGPAFQHMGWSSP
jgi:hypothetical protein